MYITAIQLTAAILMIVAVLIQNKGAGMGEAIGGTGAVYQTKRGVEKKLFIVTIVLVVIFLASSLANVIL